MSAKEELFDSIADVYTLPVLRWAAANWGTGKGGGSGAGESCTAVPRRAGRRLPRL